MIEFSPINILKKGN